MIDAGKIINEKTGRNQILGAVVMGIGMGMFEETIYDKRNAKPLNNNFADYLVATNADIPEMECVFVQYPDLHLNEYGARGIGEIGLAGVASALTMAVYHATGVRVRKLPVRMEGLMAGVRDAAAHWMTDVGDLAAGMTGWRCRRTEADSRVCGNARRRRAMRCVWRRWWGLRDQRTGGRGRGWC